jgi:biotin carboxyl carrier protein
MDADPEEFRQNVETFIEEYTTAFGQRHVTSGETQLVDLLNRAETPDEATETVLTRLGEWEEKSASKIALNESTQAGAAISRMVYAGAGVSLLVWRSNPRACPLCAEMNGKTVDISGPFLTEGDQVEGDDTVQTLEVKQVRNHPPLHGGCQCSVSPG